MVEDTKSGWIWRPTMGQVTEGGLDFRMWAIFARRSVYSALALYEHMKAVSRVDHKHFVTLSSVFFPRIITESDDYAIAFMQQARHSIELVLKSVWLSTHALTNEQHTALVGHNLACLWQDVRGLLHARRKELPPDTRLWGVMDDLVEFFDRCDSKGMSFRYPSDRSGHCSPSVVDINNLGPVNLTRIRHQLDLASLLTYAAEEVAEQLQVEIHCRR